ncbi:GTP-binding protein 10 homolog [Ctenocephalides felis]|uniref:GTP-binding protein 10 homolog n=1 Tax=Ctenocephalides felis TaxID=7515 RepID=UPI000E6E386B|nr:GTP-binding protein 10 homolog [Ctenocephalides felis]
MVLLYQALRFPQKKARQYLKSKLIDSLRLHVRGGTGGNGLPKYGGVGGQGGCIYFEASSKNTLKGVLQKWPQKRLAAGHGQNSTRLKILGEKGNDLKLDVPVGIKVIREDGKLIEDMDEEGKTCVVARGGFGGNAYNNYLGMKGQAYSVTLDLKLIADVGLVGLPNAGKSTLLRAISRAKPKVASYPFTTIRPNIGVMEYRDLRQITVADLPGLIEGAHANMGMGHKFLKHVERTKLLLLICDIEGFQLSRKHPQRSCIETVFILNKELELYKPDLLEKPAILLVNKMDKEIAKEEFEKIKDNLFNLQDSLHMCPNEALPNQVIQFDHILPISAKTNSSDINRVKETIREVLDLHDQSQTEEVDEIETVRKLKQSLIERGPSLT